MLPQWKTGQKEEITTALNMKDSDSFPAKSVTGATEVAELKPGLTSSSCSSLNLMLKIRLRLTRHFMPVFMSTFRPIQGSGVQTMSQGTCRQVLKDCSLLQFDESLDVMDTAQLVVFIRMVFQDCTTKKEESMPGEDIHNKFKKIHPQ